MSNEHKMIRRDFSEVSKINEGKLNKSKLPLLSKTPGPRSPKNDPKIIKTEKNDFELELTTKHRILKSMIHVDKDDFSNVDSSSLSYSFKRMSAGMKVLGNYGNQAALLDKVFENLHNSKSFNYRINESQSKATKKCLASQNKSWAKKHGQVVKKTEAPFSEFLESFFDSLDEDGDESITAPSIIMPLMSYGITVNPKYLERVI